MSEEQKEVILNTYLKEKLEISKNVSADIEDISEKLFYSPRSNKVPLKLYARNKYNNKLSSIVEGNKKIEDFQNFLCILHLFNNDEFWLLKRVIDMKNKCNSIKYNDKTNIDEILLNIEIPYFNKSSKEKFSYMINSNTKQVYLKPDENISFREYLIIYKRKLY